MSFMNITSGYARSRSQRFLVRKIWPDRKDEVMVVVSRLLGDDYYHLPWAIRKQNATNKQMIKEILTGKSEIIGFVTSLMSAMVAEIQNYSQLDSKSSSRFFVLTDQQLNDFIKAIFIACSASLSPIVCNIIARFSSGRLR